MIGTLVSHYKILSRIGAGAMGEVYLAEDMQLDRRVAIKFLPLRLSADPHALARFQREAKAAASLRHPNVITIHDFGVCGEKTYIVMAYVEGTPLSTVIGEGRLTVRRSGNIACQICDGLSEAHRAGIVHRDIKPDNVHIDRAGHAIILDFGLALRHDLSTLTGPNTAVGTIRYMSPEQARGEAVDNRSDIFSLGSVLYEMLAGRRPFDGPHAAAVLYAIANKTQEPVQHLNPSVREDMARVVEKALAKDPDQRFQSAEAMLSALQTAMGAQARIDRIRWRNRRMIMFLAASLATTLALALAAWKLPWPDRNVRNVSQSMAVLPFANLSNDPQQEFFVDGMTDVLITRLAQIRDLKVISRTSTMRYKTSNKSLREIANELHVGLVVEGAVLRSGDAVRITAQLINAADDNHLWAGSYEENARDIISLQSQLATEIAREVSVRVTPDEQARLESRGSEHPEAYEAFLRGVFFFNRRTPADVARAIDSFDQSVALDSTFAPALAGLADCHVIRAMWNWDRATVAFPKAREASERALLLDPTLAEAHASLAMEQLFFDWDWTSAEENFRTAIKLEPNNAIAYHWYGLCLMLLGRYDDAIRQMKKAVDLDPYSPIMLTILAQAYDMKGQYEPATHEIERVIELYPEFGMAWFVRSWIAYHQQYYPEAIEYARKAQALHVERAEVSMLASMVKMGDDAAAKEVLAAAFKQEGIQYHTLAALYAYYGNPERAYELTERAIQEHEWFVVGLRCRWMDPLRDDGRFQKLVRDRVPIRGL